MTMLGFTLVESCSLRQQSAQITNDAELTFVQQIVVAGRYAIREKNCTISLSTNLQPNCGVSLCYARMSCTATRLVGHAINRTRVLQEYVAL